MSTDAPVANTPPPGWAEHFDDGGLFVRVWTRRTRGAWFVIAPDFDVVARGSSEVQAVEELIELLEDYLSISYSDELPWEQTLRPLPLADRLRWQALEKSAPR